MLAITTLHWQDAIAQPTLVALRVQRAVRQILHTPLINEVAHRLLSRLIVGPVESQDAVLFGLRSVTTLCECTELVGIAVADLVALAHNQQFIVDEEHWLATALVLG